MSRYAALFLLLLSYIYFSEGYKYRLITREDSFDRCRNLKCEDGQPHSICLKANGPSANCAEFEILKMTAKRKNILINGHNGIRNKIAGYFHIANMLLLHWDEDLHEMARGFLTRCTRGKDSCNFIYNDTFTVGQTYYFNPKLPLNRFVITIMRHWFLEANDIETFADFMKQKPPNMTQMTYPPTEFLGCAAAEMFGGHIMRCYYSPAFNDDPKAYIIGKPCSECPTERASCSRVFHGLCGVDLPLPGNGCRLRINFILLFLSIMFYMASI